MAISSVVWDEEFVGTLRRHRAGLSLTALAALASFLGALETDGTGLRQCPHHDALPEAAGAPSPPHPHEHAMGGEGHASTGTADRSGAVHGQDQQRSDPHRDHGPCTCLGCGSCSGGLALAVPHYAFAGGSSPDIFAAATAAPAWLVPRVATGWTPYLPHAPPRSA